MTGGFLTNVACSLKPKSTLKNPVGSGKNLTGGKHPEGSLDLFNLPYPVAPDVPESFSSSQTAQVVPGHTAGLLSAVSRTLVPGGNQQVCSQ